LKTETKSHILIFLSELPDTINDFVQGAIATADIDSRWPAYIWIFKYL
jgi:hypothetical protein